MDGLHIPMSGYASGQPKLPNTSFDFFLICSHFTIPEDVYISILLKALVKLHTFEKEYWKQHIIKTVFVYKNGHHLKRENTACLWVKATGGD